MVSGRGARTTSAGLALWLCACAGGGDGGSSAWDPPLGESGEGSTGLDESTTGSLEDETTDDGSTSDSGPEGDTTGSDPDDGSTGEPAESTGEEPPLENVVCYPGQTGDFSTCLPLHDFAPLPAGYEYPPPLNGDPNYRSPVALLDLEELDPAIYLAPNFQLGEIAQVNKGRYAVVQVHAIVSLQGLRDQVGALGVNSGYRSPAHNAATPGSATYSRHMYGDAYDLDPIEVGLGTLENACVGAGGQLVEYTTHVHCDFRFDPVDEEFYGPAMAQAWPEPPPYEAALERGADGTWRAPAEGFDEGPPQRRWTALDAAGQVLAEAIGPEFVAPAGTATVRVRVGAQLERTAVVP